MCWMKQPRPLQPDLMIDQNNLNNLGIRPPGNICAKLLSYPTSRFWQETCTHNNYVRISKGMIWWFFFSTDNMKSWERVNLGAIWRAKIFLVCASSAWQKAFLYFSAHSLHGIFTALDKIDKLSKGAKIRNRYNQVQHLTQDTDGKVTNHSKTPQTRAKRSDLSQQVTTRHT